MFTEFKDAVSKSITSPTTSNREKRNEINHRIDQHGISNWG